MRVGIDTNILWPIIGISPEGQNTENFEHIRELVRQILRRKGQLFLLVQNLVELYAIATKPREAKGCGLEPTAATALIGKIKSEFVVLPEDSKLADEFLRLCNLGGVRGKQAHDARLAASYLVNGITIVLTANVKHFRRFADIRVLSPDDSLEGFIKT